MEYLSLILGLGNLLYSIRHCYITKTNWFKTQSNSFVAGLNLTIFIILLIKNH